MNQVLDKSGKIVHSLVMGTHNRGSDNREGSGIPVSGKNQMQLYWIQWVHYNFGDVPMRSNSTDLFKEPFMLACSEST